MGIKDLFSEKTTGIIAKTSLEEEVVRNTPELESSENIKEQRERIDRFIPLVDFSDPNNFVHYGSAEAYYKDAISRIYNQYPYDGTAREKQEFFNKSAYLDLYLFENEYPRTTGYINFSADGWGTISSPGSALTGAGDSPHGGFGAPASADLEYIKVVGGPHTASGGMSGSLALTFDDSNIYNSDIYGFEGVDSMGRVGTRESNLKFDLSKGVSTEFWIKKGDYQYGRARGSVMIVSSTPSEYDGHYLVMSSSDGTGRQYQFDDDQDGSQTGTTLTNPRRVRIDITGDSSANAIAAKVVTAINHENGHNGKIIASQPSAMSNVVQLIQATHGPAGNHGIFNYFSLPPHNTPISAVPAHTVYQPYSFSSSVDFISPTSRVAHRARPAEEAVFDLWNGAASSSVGYGRLLITLSGSSNSENPFKVHLASGSNVWDMSFGGSTTTTASLKDTWNHVAFTFLSSSADNQLQTNFYLNGTLQDSQTTTTVPFGQVTGSLIAYIGALQTAPSGNSYFDGTSAALNMTGYGKFSGSLDEFRYWKSKRTERDIQRNWWTQVRGGTNKDIANAELGVYYKFNEGITGTSSVDRSVLDYSGRISNGDWVGYPSSNARNTGSAIISASAAPSEFEDPIIYSHHDEVQSLYNTLAATGSVYDNQNNASIKDSIPSWIQEDEELNGAGHLDKITQIMGSYFDTLHLQVESLSEFAEASYPTASHMKTVPFSDHLLSSQGLYAPEIFVEASILEHFANRKDDKEYSVDINDVKNQIYQNIYNNLIFIYKSKGTEKAFRNLIHCYGLGDEVIKFNAYGNNTTFKLDDTYYNSTIRKNYIDFNSLDRFGGTVYQNSSSNTETTDVTYVSGTNANFANTAEVEVIFPRKLEFSDTGHFYTPFLSASIFGYHTASADPSKFNWPANTILDQNFEIYAVRTHEESKDVYFQITSSALPGFSLTSSVYSNVYDNQKWNFAVRFKDAKWPYSTGITGSGTPNDVKMEFIGYNTEYGVVKNQFSLTASGLNDKFLTGHRRYYAGASRTNFTGAIATNTDVKISSVRHWATYLNDAVIKAHSLDPENFGVLHPARNTIFAADSTDYKVDNNELLESETLALHWDFSQITGSDALGQFEVDDACSGSVSLRSRYPSDGNLSHIIANMYAGRGYFPSTTSSAKVVDKNYVASSKQRLPEVVNSDDAVNVLSQDDDLFPSDPAVSQTFFAFEKSMYGIISQEMLNIFGTIVEFNNLIGEVTSKYRSGYKDLDRLRALFFEKIENNPDLDKFIDYYKWIDNSLSVMIQQLVPASANVADEIRTVVESHIFERSSYRHQYPMVNDLNTAATAIEGVEGGVKGIGELAYDWKHGHAPVSDAQGTNALWWRERAGRDNARFGTSTSINSARGSINDIILSFNSSSYSKEHFGGQGTDRYQGSSYSLRQLSSPFKLTADIKSSPDRLIHGGYNFPRSQKPDLVANIIRPGSPTSLKVSKGSFKDIAAAETGKPIVETKRRFEQTTTDNSSISGEFEGDGKAEVFSPVVLYSSSATTGYISNTSNVEFAGYHTDVYGPSYETPMQGPFTGEHVGGKQHRHISPTINPALTSSDNRPEAWEVHNGNTFTTRSSMHYPPAYASYHRDGLAKRPVNIKNVQYSTASAILGNYSNTYEIVQTSDRSINKSDFVRNEGYSSASAGTEVFSDLVDYTKPTRRKTPHVIVERFSAPGDPATMGDAAGGSGLDFSSAQYSPYNNLNYRNLVIRQPLQSQLVERSEQFGIRSGSFISEAEYYTLNTTASYHKVNANKLQRIVYTNDQFGGNAAACGTGSMYDNYYVQHMIPRSDRQYTWINASVLSSDPESLGYFPKDGLASSSAGLVAAVSFVSSSAMGAENLLGSAVGTVPVPYARATNPAEFTPVDFVGLNTSIVEPISGSDFTLGYALPASSYNYYNWADMGAYALATSNPESFLQRIGYWTATNKTFRDDAYALNSILSHRNGPYGHPTWKQIRVGEGALARFYRRNNIYTHTPLGGVEKTVSTPNGLMTVRDKYASSLFISQSVVTSRCKPITQQLLVKSGVRRTIEVSADYIKAVVVRSTYANGITYFDDNNFNQKTGIKARRGFSSYDEIKKMYLYGALDSTTSPVVGVRRVHYSEVVYPSIANSYTNKVRGRTGYQNNFWRDSRTDRTTLAATKKDRNSMGYVLAQSAWALDADETFAEQTQTTYPVTGGLVGHAATGYKPGELQNRNVQFHSGSRQGGGRKFLRGGPLYSRYHIMPTTASVIPRWGMVGVQNHLRTPGISDYNFGLHKGSMFRGQAKWEAGTKAGRAYGTASAFTASARAPFADTYDEWFSEIRSKGQAMSIIPEFRISEHMSFYKNNDYDFTVTNPIALQIPGAPTGSNIPQNESEDKFYKVFTNSDFLKHFDIIKDDHKDFVEPWSITIKCKAIKKFIAYDGFYPAERTLQMASQFSKSYGSHIKYTGANRAQAAALRSFVTPLFAPGILYNTIKSGIAVDYPIMTGSFAKRPIFDLNSAYTDPATATGEYQQQLYSASFAIASNSRPVAATYDHGHGWDKRIPFEALLEPERYMSYVNIADDEPSPYCWVDATSSWAGRGNNLYKYMMHNFLAETTSFFMKGGTTTSLKSKPESEWLSITPGRPYGMRIKIRRSMNSVKPPTGPWGEFPLPQNAALFSAYEPEVVEIGDYEATQMRAMGAGSNNATPRENFTMYSRPSAFGPPLAGVMPTNNAGMYRASGSIFEFGSDNGIYGSHTPPYYDGESWIDIVHYSKGLVAVSSSHPTRPHTWAMVSGSDVEYPAYQPTMTEIFSLANAAVFNSGDGGTPGDGTFVRYWRYDQEELGRNLGSAIPSSYHRYNAAGIGPAGGSYINNWAMQGDASLNIFKQDGTRWSIESKFETPMLNFNHVTSSDGTFTPRDSLDASSTIPRGMWHQFGRLPKADEGVFLEVTDIPDGWLANHPSATLIHDPAGIISANNRTPRIHDNLTSANISTISYYNQYNLPQASFSAFGSDYSVQSMGSLIDVCGFGTAPKKFGKLRGSKKIWEAIVAIPFIIKKGRRKFFTLPPDDSGVMPGPSIADQMIKMQKYVIPPKFDFTRNDTAKKIAMYIFEFEHKLDKDDLSHIWQNLPPKLGVKAESARATVSHELFTNELMGNWKSVANLQATTTERSGIKSEVRWMVFKAKQRAKTDYFGTMGNAQHSAYADIPEYSYNWPYDFCSIVEMASLEPEIEFGVEEMKLKDAVQAKLNAEAEAWFGATLGTVGGTSAGAAQFQSILSTGPAGITNNISAFTSNLVTDEDKKAQRSAEWANFMASSNKSLTGVWDDYANDLAIDEGVDEFNWGSFTSLLSSILIIIGGTVAAIMTGGAAGVLIMGLAAVSSALSAAGSGYLYARYPEAIAEKVEPILWRQQGNWINNAVIPTARDREHGTHFLKTTSTGTSHSITGGGNL